MNTKEKEPATVGAAASSAESSACQIDSVNSIHDNSQKVNIPDYIADALKDSVRVGIHMWQLTGNVWYKDQADKIKSWLEEKAVC
ncbi:MAG: hypothetical protein IJO29_01705 [Oscillospiraceae bacterium]|nr:hypothetical protein [Oscillospiraceae bacterium]